jgi:hypothetical protein
MINEDVVEAPIQQTGTPPELTPPVIDHIKQGVNATPGSAPLYYGAKICRRRCHDRGVGPALGLQHSNQDRREPR